MVVIWVGVVDVFFYVGLVVVVVLSEVVGYDEVDGVFGVEVFVVSRVGCVGL